MEYDKCYKMTESCVSHDAIKKYIQINPESKALAYHKAWVLYSKGTSIFNVSIGIENDIGYIKIAPTNNNDENYISFLQSDYLPEYNTKDDEITIYNSTLDIKSHNVWGSKISLNITCYRS